MARRLARHTDRETKTGHDRWLVSYSDFITLLFAFFVVMYSISQVNEDKYRTLTETLNDTFVQRSVNQEQGEQDTESAAEQTELIQLDDLQLEFEQSFASLAKGSLTLSANENWVELTLPSELLFASGSAEPKKQASKIFAQISDIVANYENEIQVIGHTDNIPINNREYRNNWYLSSARAVAIVNYLSFQGVNPERLSAIGFGEYRPVASNDTDEGRAANRRVVLRVSSQAVPAEKTNMVDFFNDADLAIPSKTSLESSTVENEQSEPSASNKSQMQPVRLKGGDLLFTSDPDLPRNRERADP
jgi:chemotaxis protein MotB